MVGHAKGKAGVTVPEKYGLKKQLVTAQTTRTGSLVSELIGAEQPIGVEGRARFKVRSAGCASQACDTIFRQHESKHTASF